MSPKFGIMLIKILQFVRSLIEANWNIRGKLPNFSELKCGYLEKGSKRWVEDDDLEAMYEIFDSTDEIIIWCEGRLSEEQQRKKDAGKKRKLEDADSNDTTSKWAAREKS